jgi:hypothetical protein
MSIRLTEMTMFYKALSLNDQRNKIAIISSLVYFYDIVILLLLNLLFYLLRSYSLLNFALIFSICT